MQKFLIIQTAFIGDVVLATPLIEKLHHFFPDAEIDFLLRKGNEQLFINHPYIHDVLIWDKKENKQKNLLRMLTVYAKTGMIKSLTSKDFLRLVYWRAFSGAKEVIGFDKNPLSFLFTKKIRHQYGGDQPVHEITRNLELIKEFTDGNEFKPKLYPSPDDFNYIDALLSSKFITVSPASVWFTKQFPASKWISFIKSIPEGIGIYLLGGPGDISLSEFISESCNRTELQVLTGSLTYLQSAALMSRAIMNYVNDSAPMHFASAMNAPVTAVYCSTIPGFGFGPLSETRYIVEIDHPLYCRPCGLHGYRSCPEKHFRCAMDIRLEQMIETLPV